MSGPSSVPSKWTPYLLSTLRIVVGMTLIRHGLQKLFGFPARRTLTFKQCSVAWEAYLRSPAVCP